MERIELLLSFFGEDMFKNSDSKFDQFFKFIIINTFIQKRIKERKSFRFWILVTFFLSLFFNDSDNIVSSVFCFVRLTRLTFED